MTLPPNIAGTLIGKAAGIAGGPVAGRVMGQVANQITGLMESSAAGPVSADVFSKLLEMAQQVQSPQHTQGDINVAPQNNSPALRAEGQTGVDLATSLLGQGGLTLHPQATIKALTASADIAVRTFDPRSTTQPAVSTTERPAERPAEQPASQIAGQITSQPASQIAGQITSQITSQIDPVANPVAALVHQLQALADRLSTQLNPSAPPQAAVAQTAELIPVETQQANQLLRSINELVGQITPNEQTALAATSQSENTQPATPQSRAALQLPTPDLSPTTVTAPTVAKIASTSVPVEVISSASADGTASAGSAPNPISPTTDLRGADLVSALRTTAEKLQALPLNNTETAARAKAKPPAPDTAPPALSSATARAPAVSQIADNTPVQAARLQALSPAPLNAQQQISTQQQIDALAALSGSTTPVPAPQGQGGLAAAGNAMNSGAGLEPAIHNQIAPATQPAQTATASAQTQLIPTPGPQASAPNPLSLPATNTAPVRTNSAAQPSAAQPIAEIAQALGLAKSTPATPSTTTPQMPSGPIPSTIITASADPSKQTTQAMASSPVVATSEAQLARTTPNKSTTPAMPSSNALTSPEQVAPNQAPTTAGFATAIAAQTPAATTTAATATAMEGLSPDPLLATQQQSASQTMAPTTVSATQIDRAYQTPQLKLPQLALEMTRHLNAGINRFQIRMDPPELGRIDIRMEMDQAGALNARLAVERPETLELLQRDARALERALAQAGLDADKTNLEFSLKKNPFSDGSAQDGQDQNSDRSAANSSSNSDNPDVELPTAATINAYRGMVSPGGVNLLA